MYKDKTLICKVCGQKFVFSSAKQKFFSAMKVSDDPRYCPECRDAHVKALNAITRRAADTSVKRSRGGISHGTL